MSLARRRSFVRSILAVAAVAACSAPESGKNEPPAPRDTRMDWWREARFGLFIHWGLYAVPAGEWNGNTEHAEWIRETAHIPVEEYERFQREFDPVRFDADQWVALAREAGMRYLVITSKHHDGFALFDSAVSDWDVMGTPFRRDVLAELSAACARGGVRFCTYHSIMDWHHPDYLPRRTWEAEARPAAGADFERFEDYLHSQVREVITKYDPGVMWFDGEWENTWSHARGVELYELCRSLDPDLIVNNRVDVHRGGMGGFSQSDEAVGDFGTPEQEIPATGLAGVDWETCMTMNDFWGWNENDRDWKSVETLVRNLIDVASKGGNYLLNVGPKPDGTFPDEAVERLKGIGAWMRKHGEAIHGTSASPFDALEWGRCTVKKDGEDSILYLHVFERPMNGRIVLPGLVNEPVSAGWLAGPRLALPVRRVDRSVEIALPGALPDPIASVVTLRVKGEPIILRPPVIVAESDIFVRPLKVELEPAEMQMHYTLDGSEPTTDSPSYEGPFELTESAVVSARYFTCFVGSSPVTQRRFERVRPKPGWIRDPDEGKFPAGLAVRSYRGDWDRLPDMDTLTPRDEPSAEVVGLSASQRNEYFGLRFLGTIDVPADDVYTFALASDDGSDLWIDDARVVDNDGLHGTTEVRAQVALGKGEHPIEVRWFNKTGGAELVLRWAPLGAELSPAGPFCHGVVDVGVLEAK